MIGIIKRLFKNKDNEFQENLRIISSLFVSNVTFLDSRQARELTETTEQIYQKKAPEQKSYSAADFYLDSLIGQVGHMTINGIIPKFTSLEMWRETDRFLDSAPIYKSNTVLKGMIGWMEVLARQGVDQRNFHPDSHASIIASE